MIAQWLRESSLKVRVALGVVIVGGVFFLGLLLVALTAQGPYPLAPSDTISSWTFAGAYQDGGKNEVAVKSEIVRLKKLLGGDTQDYEILVGIASQFVLIGDGKSAYLYLSKAIEENPNKGLAYFNLGHLMEQLGAIETARTAYTKAVQVEPENTVYRSYKAVFILAHPAKT